MTSFPTLEVLSGIGLELLFDIIHAGIYCKLLLKALHLLGMETFGPRQENVLNKIFFLPFFF